MHLRAAAVAPALAASLILTLASPSLAAQPTPPGSGAPPRSFWGNTGAIPPATHVLEIEVINRTNGRFPASRVYWSFNGQEKSIAKQRYIDMAFCAGLNRHVAQLPAPEQTDPAHFYKARPANYYAEFWHKNAINHLAYGFPYDDYAGQSSDISVTNPKYLVVAVGW